MACGVKVNWNCADLQGQTPTAEQIVTLRNSLLQSTDLRRTSNLESQLRGQLNLSEDASESLVMLLQVSNPWLSVSQFSMCFQN